MYDYNNGRFLSVDPFIQAPTSTQSMNPYTYIFNNPLSGIDPTGYAAEQLLNSHLASKGIDVAALKTAQSEAAVKIVVAVDTISDLIAPVKGLSKKAIKETFKIVKDQVKKILTKPKKATSNGNKNKSQATTTTQNKDVSSTESQDEITVYRGVDNASPAIDDAKKGIVKPRGGETGHTDANRHSAGETENSNLSSFSTDKKVAQDFATNDSGEGVVMTARIKKSDAITPNKPFDAREKEVLVKGDIKVDKVEAQTERVDVLGEEVN